LQAAIHGLRESASTMMIRVRSQTDWKETEVTRRLKVELPEYPSALSMNAPMAAPPPIEAPVG